MYAIPAPLASEGLRGPLLVCRALFRGRATARPRVCRAALPVARPVSHARPSCPRAWCPRASSLDFPRRSQSQTLCAGAPVEVLEQANQVGVFLGLLVGEVELVQHGAVVRHGLAPPQLGVLAIGVVGLLAVGLLQARLDLVQLLDVPLVEREVGLQLFLGQEALALRDETPEILGFMSHVYPLYM